jgi:hypothetical protein
VQITQKYSHLNGEEYLLVHHKKTYEEIRRVIAAVDAEKHRTKRSKEKRKGLRLLYSPKGLNAAFKSALSSLGWTGTTYSYYVTTDRELLERIALSPLDQQRETLRQHGQAEPIRSYKQTDYVKDKLAIEVQFGKYSFVAYDLFVKHMLFYSGRVINVGIEILPTRLMQSEMSSGIAYYEGEVYNILRQGRSNPPVPLLILGIEPDPLAATKAP